MTALAYAPHVKVDTEAFQDHGLSVSADAQRIGDMMSSYYGMTPAEIERTSIVVAPPNKSILGKLRRELIAGFFVPNATLSIDGTEYHDRNVSVIQPHSANILKRVNHMVHVHDFTPLPSPEQKIYSEVLIHEISHNADHLRGELGSRKVKKLLKLGGTATGLAAGIYAQNKLGDMGPFKNSGQFSTYEAMRASAEYYMRAWSILGSMAVGRYLGYRTIPTERRAFRNMRNKELLARYADMISVEPISSGDNSQTNL